jgi:large subunit ribosomal protein L21
MYAIFESGGKQYKAIAGKTINIEKVDVPIGESFELKNVLMVVDDDNIKVGTPVIEDAVVVCRALDNISGKKIIVFKSKKRKGYKRKIGHRQKYMRIQVDEIRTGATNIADTQVDEIQPETVEGGDN